MRRSFVNVAAAVLRCRRAMAGAKGLCACAAAAGQVEVTDPRVQELLGRMTGVDLDRVFAKRLEPLVLPRYRLLTQEQLDKENKAAIERAREKLKMPPILPVRQERGKAISRDERLAGLHQSKLVFTDLTLQKSHREQSVVVREPDGTLRDATWDEWERMCQLYFPALGRKMWLPEVLQEAELGRVLEEGRHLEVLELANTQCEPDSPDYIRVHKTVYEHIYSHELYDCLRSSQYFGGLVWHLLVQGFRITGLMKDMLKRELFSDAEDLVQLCALCCPDHVVMPQEHLSGLALVENFCKTNGLSSLLELLPQHKQTSTNVI